MHALRELQFAFGDSLLHGDGYALQQVRGRGLSAAQRVGIYRNNLYATLVGALRLTFPVVEKLVGAEFFHAAAERHVRGYPSASGDVRQYGDGFAHFLERFEPASSLPYLPDIARLEWAWNEVFIERAELALLDFDALTRVPQGQWEALRFQLSRAARLVTSPFPILRIWQINQDGCRDDARVSLEEGGAQLLVLRRGLEVEIHALSIAEYTFLAALHAGESLGAAMDRGYEADEGFPLAAVLQKQFALGAIASWCLPGVDLSTSQPH